MSETQTDTAPVDEPRVEPAPEPEAAPDKYEAMLREWVTSMIHNSPISRVTEAVNHFNTVALPDLKRRLKEIV